MNRNVRYLQNALRNLFHVNAPKHGHTPLKSRLCVQSRTFHANNQLPQFRSYYVLGAISFVKIFEFLGLSDEKYPEIKELLSRAKELLQEGREEEASKLYNEALIMAVNSQDSADEFYIKKKLAVIAFNSKRYRDAEKLFLEVRDYHSREGVPGNDQRMLYIDLRLAEIYDILKIYEKADERYKICAKNIKPLITSEADAELIELWLLFLISRAHYLLHRGIFGKSAKYFAKAYDACSRIRGEMNEQTVVLLQQLGSVCYQNGDLDNAIKHLRKAIELGKHLPGLVELSNSYVSLGNILLKQGLVEEAKSLCHQGLLNARRHKYEQGIKESNACLAEATQNIP